jgi:hypothetical protein
LNKFAEKKVYGVEEKCEKRTIKGERYSGPLEVYGAFIWGRWFRSLELLAFQIGTRVWVRLVLVGSPRIHRADDDGTGGRVVRRAGQERYSKDGF